LQPASKTGLRRELGLRDLTLFAIACIVGARWIPAAAHAGPGSVTLWLLAAVFFVLPLATAVGALAVKYPGPGGLYLWTRGDFGPWHGFLCFWMYWMGIACWFPTAALFYMKAGLSMIGPSYAHVTESRVALLTVALIAIWIALTTNIVGLNVGKGTQNVGGAAMWVRGIRVMALGVLVWMQRGSATVLNLAPKWDWNTVSFWATIAYGLSGMEAVGGMNGEIHDPERTLPRAAWIASIFAVLFYAGGTIALLVILPQDKIGELNGFSDAAQSAGTLLHLPWLLPAIALLVLATGVGQIGGLGTSVSRLPFAAGVDHLLPAAFGKTHPRWGTPHISILALGAVATFLLVVYQLGDSMRAAYDELVSLMVITGFLPYLYIFGSAWKAGRRLSALSGWAITILAIVCSVAPTAEITNVWLFEAKLAAGTAAVIGSAWFVYRRNLKSAMQL